MTSHHTVVRWIGPVMILTAIVNPNRLEAQEPGEPSASAPMQEHQMMENHMVSPDLMIPNMSATNGRKLFASKGCVVCHAVNGVGGTDAVPLDASTMIGMINPFDFVASMWRGARPMIDLQNEELGGQVEFTGRELGDIIAIAFVHHAEEQRKFSEADIPPDIKAAMTAMEMKESEGKEENQDGMNTMKPESDGGGN